MIRDTTPPPTSAPADLCGRCLVSPGKLCVTCGRAVLPQLAVNLGWLRLISETHIEQKRRQAPAAELVAIEKAKRREQRKHARAGLRGLLVHIATAA